MFQYLTPTQPSQLNDAILLFNEYANSLNISLAFQNFSEELNIIDTMYGSPSGCLLLVYNKEQAIACAAYRKIGEGICELKRMYIKPSYRRLKIGETLLEMLCSRAFDNGYTKMRLDTLDTMLPAIGLYKKHAFYEISAYYHNPNEGVVYMEKVLSDKSIV
jgi:ribosomal protein S18 acetylase RimI-like enzyme